eukprot:s780_g4.t1
MLSVRSFSGEALAAVSTEECRSVLELKAHLRKELGFPICLQQLVSEGNCLEDSMDAPADSHLVRMSEIPEDHQDAAGEEFAIAAECGLLETVRFFLQAGVDKDWVDGNGFSALMHAADAGHAELVRLLVEAGAVKNLQSDEGLTALMLAADSGKTAIVRILVDSGADVCLRDASYDTALMKAAFGGHSEIVRLLLDAGTNVDNFD